VVDLKMQPLRSTSAAKHATCSAALKLIQVIL
jgi:hypothetical protein